ncbi:hypothetical protein DFH28DRAFT_927221 [Melampsora americana]|nr:hypothetical protein DFH28DRAFT_927221 [Melampsora americana]
MSDPVLRVVKELADHARDQLQAQVMPRLQSLFVKIVQPLEAGSELTEAEIWERTNEEDKGRLALLRLIAVEFYQELSQPIPSERGSLWQRVDSRLEWVSTLSKNHQAKNFENSNVSHCSTSKDNCFIITRDWAPSRGIVLH